MMKKSCKGRKEAGSSDDEKEGSSPKSEFAVLLFLHLAFFCVACMREKEVCLEVVAILCFSGWEGSKEGKGNRHEKNNRETLTSRETTTQNASHSLKVA